MGFIDQAAGQIISGLDEQLSYGLGEITGYNDALKRDQLEMQGNLQKMEIEGSKELGTFNLGLQKGMIDYTDASHQVERLKEAGLNPALMYETGGAGGQTTGSAQAGKINGGQAATTAQTRANNIALQGVALQNAKLRSEIEVNESIAEANKASAENSRQTAEETSYRNVEGKVRAEAFKLFNEQEGLGTFTVLSEYEAKQAENVFREVNARVSSCIREIQGQITGTKEGNQLIIDGFKAEFQQQIKNVGLTEEQGNYLLKMSEARFLEIYGDDEKTINEKELKTWLENTDKIVKGMLWSAGINAAGDIVTTVTGGIMKNGMAKQQLNKTENTTWRKDVSNFDKHGNITGGSSTTYSGQKH